jgi:hypothetical protein
MIETIDGVTLGVRGIQLRQLDTEAAAAWKTYVRVMPRPDVSCGSFSDVLQPT